jgi:hypothetical protein
VTADPRSPGRHPGWQVVAVAAFVIVALAATIWFTVR